MLQNNCELLVLVKGKPVTEYLHNGQIYIEGREGSEYEIEFRNPNPFRVMAVISVDGLSILDGKTAGPESPGYLVEAHGNVRIPGWKVDEAKVARFAFGGKKGSYAAVSSEGEVRNTGVIGALVYRERYQQPIYRTPVRTLGGPTPSYRGSSIYNATGVNHLANMPIGSSVTRGMSSGVSLHSTSNTMQHSAGDAISPFVISRYNSGNAPVASAAAAAPRVQQELGTVFGRAEEFATREVAFERGDLQVMLVLYYDSSRALRQRGIVLERPSRARYQNEPDAFPGMTTGCKPPAGWTG